MRLGKHVGAWALVCLAALSLCPAGALPAQAAGFGPVVYQKDSLYEQIRVYQNGSLVTLQFGKVRPDLVQSQVDLSDMRRNVNEYTVLSFCGLLYNPQPKAMLVLGLGGGVIPREMHHSFPDMKVDVAEIDPDIPPIAERFFGFKQDDKLKVTVQDGRFFIGKVLRQKPVAKYDYIVLDAFRSDYIPFHLMTKEFLEQVKGVLEDNGVVVANVFSDNALADAELKTYLAVFGRCQVYLGAYSGNAMLVSPGASAPVLTPEEALAHAKALKLPQDFSIDMSFVASRLQPDAAPVPGAIVLTDDKAPVNYLRTQKAEDIRTGPADSIELLNGDSYLGKLLSQDGRQVTFQVTSGGSNARMVWPTGAVHALTVNGIRRVINEVPSGAPSRASAPASQ